MTGRAAVASFFIGLVLFCGGMSRTTAALDFKETPNYPDISGFSFYNGSGELISLQDFKGKYVLLNVWAIWCAPCVDELPTLGILRQKMGGEKFEVLAVSLDWGVEKQFIQFFESHDIQGLDVYMDKNGGIMRQLKIRNVPTTVLIDPSGKELGRLEGFDDWSTAEAEAFINSYISKN